MNLKRGTVINGMDKTKNACKYALKDELGDLYCGNDKGENLGDFCVCCGGYVGEGRQVCVNCEKGASYEEIKRKMDMPNL